MSDDVSNSPTEISRLTADLLDGRLDDAGWADLSRRLSEDPAARVQYVRVLLLDGLLQRELRAQMVASDLEASPPALYPFDDSSSRSMHDAMILPALHEEPSETEVPAVVLSFPRPKSRPPRRASRRWWGFGAAASVLLALGAWAWFGRGAAPAAVLTACIDPQWADAPDSIAPGTSITPGQSFSLNHGYAQFRFSDGARVVIEAPARFAVRSGSQVELWSGKLSALVEGEKGFTVVTPAATVVDLGTEFGVAASSARAEVEVFRGKVSLAPPTDLSGAGRIARQGEAFRVDAAGTISAEATHPGAFVRAEQFDSWVNAGQMPPLERWQAYSERMQRDPALALYYRFDRAEASDRLVNDARTTAGRFDVPFTTSPPVWTKGRWPGKSALDTRRAGQQRLIVRNYPLTASGRLTVAGWVYARSRANWAAIAKNRGEKLHGQFALSLWGSDGDLDAKIFADGGREIDVREGPSNPFPVGRWEFVAMVCDGRSLRLYRDGVQVGAVPCPAPASDPPIRNLAIGYRTLDDGVRPEPQKRGEYWDGAIGELAIFHTALSPAQIHEMYEAGKPD